MDSNNIVALDVGEKRIGIARANLVAKLPEPVIIVDTSKQPAGLKDALAQQQPGVVVVGMPRNMSGQETAQSQAIRAWAEGNLSELQAELGFKVVYVDETLSSVEARDLYPDKKHIDDIAACYILQTYFDTHKDKQG